MTPALMDEHPAVDARILKAEGSPACGSATNSYVLSSDADVLTAIDALKAERDRLQRQLEFIAPTEEQRLVAMMALDVVDLGTRRRAVIADGLLSQYQGTQIEPSTRTVPTTDVVVGPLVFLLYRMDGAAALGYEGTTARRGTRGQGGHRHTQPLGGFGVVGGFCVGDVGVGVDGCEGGAVGTGICSAMIGKPPRPTV